MSMYTVNKLKNICIIIMLSLSCYAEAQYALVDLWDAYNLSTKNNEDFAIAKSNLVIQKQQNRQIRSSLFPVVSIGTNYNKKYDRF